MEPRLQLDAHSESLGTFVQDDKLDGERHWNKLRGSSSFSGGSPRQFCNACALALHAMQHLNQHVGSHGLSGSAAALVTLPARRCESSMLALCRCDSSSTRVGDNVVKADGMDVDGMCAADDLADGVDAKLYACSSSSMVGTVAVRRSKISTVHL